MNNFFFVFVNFALNSCFFKLKKKFNLIITPNSVYALIELTFFLIVVYQTKRLISHIAASKIAKFEPFNKNVFVSNNSAEC